MVVDPDAHARALQLLIEQEQRLTDHFVGRQNSADGRLAAAFAAAAGFVALSLTAAASAGTVKPILIEVTVTVVAVATAVGILLRVLGGYVHLLGGAKPATESNESRDARHDLWSYPMAAPQPSQQDVPVDPDKPRTITNADLAGLDADSARLLALNVWRNRAKDARAGAIRREKLAAIAAVFLLAVLAGCVILVVLVAQASP